MNHLKQKLEDYTESEFLDFLNEFSANPRYQGEMDRESYIERWRKSHGRSSFKQST